MNGLPGSGMSCPSLGQQFHESGEHLLGAIRGIDDKGVSTVPERLKNEIIVHRLVIGDSEDFDGPEFKRQAIGRCGGLGGSLGIVSHKDV